MRVKAKKVKLDCARTGIFAIVLALALSLFPSNRSRAALWPAIDPIIKQQLEEVAYHINGIILGTLKQAAAKMLNDQVGKLVGGTSVDSAKFITDWRDFLVKKPENTTNNYINDYLGKVTSGKGSGYIPSAQSGEGFGKSYTSQLVEGAKKVTSEKEEPKLTYPGDPSQMFASGNFQNMNLYFSGINNPWAFSMNAQQEYQKKLEEEQKIADAKAQAYFGFKGTEKTDAKGNGLITNPGSITALNVANVQDIGNKILAAATHPEEVITSVVSQIITKAIEKGIGEVESNINREIEKVQNKINSATDTNTQIFGPGAQYNNPSNSGNCSGKKDGESCTLSSPYNGVTTGKCSKGLCWPASN